MTGTTQAARRLAALSPDSAPVDARMLPEQLDFVRQFARLLTYVGPDGKPEGDWQPFFANDVSFALAPIVSFDGDEALAAAERVVHDEPQPPRRDHKILLQLFGLFRQVCEWVIGVNQIGASLALGTSAGLTLESLVSQRLASLCHEVMQHSVGAKEWPTLVQDFLAKHPQEQHYLKSLWDAPVQPNDADTKPELSTVLRSFVQYIVAAQATIRTYFDDSLRATFGHRPQSALMIAFLRLLQHARNDANAITARHLDFYYRSILKLRERPTTPDRGFVCLQPTPASRETKVPAGTQLRAGKLPDGRDLIYALDRDLVVNQDTLGALKTIHAAQATTQGLTYVSHLYAAPKADSRDGLGALLVKPEQGWPTFGSDGSTNTPLLDSAPLAEVGLIVTSPMLLLRGGRRMLRVRFQFEANASSIPRSPLGIPGGPVSAAPMAFADVVHAFGDATAQTYADFAGRSQDAMVRRAMTEACEVSITTASGWQTVKRVAVHANPDQCWVELVLLLPAAFPPVEPGPSAPQEAGGMSPWPRLKVTLKPDARVYPYSFVQKLLIKSITLRAAVVGLSPSSMRSSQGPADISAPFAPFGNWPILGSYLEMADAELASKPIVRAALQVDWFNLPNAPQDLASYYAGYVIPPITNNAFQASLSIRRTGRWSTVSSCSRPLFTATDDIEAQLQPQRWFGIINQNVSATPPSLDAIRMELVAPDWAFGNTLYPQLVADTSMKAAMAISARALNKDPDSTIVLPALPKPPKPPFVPLAKSITVNYVASQQLQAQQALDEVSEPVPCFYQFGPFGYMAAPVNGTLLLDGIARAGQLYIGLRDLQPGQLVSLLFGMHETATQQSTTEPDGESPGSGSAAKGVDWYYLLDNVWQRFRNDLVEDGTAGLTRSGIVRLQTSERRMNSDNTLLPAGLFWLAVVVDDPQTRSRTTHVEAQAVAVTQVLDGVTPLASAPLPAGAIKDFVRKPPGIQSVSQALPTLGGQAAELADAFQVRVSERLRHKQRALCALDFEQIALDTLPTLMQAKCITAGAKRVSGYACEPLRAGTVRLVVVPRPPQGKNHPPQPKVAIDDLAQIRSTLLQRSAVTLRNLSVLNPVYEEVKVVLRIQLNPDTRAAYDLRSLNHDISTWLAPWRNDSSIPLPIGGGSSNMNVSDLEVFVANRVGVGRVAHLDLKVLHVYGHDGARAARWFGRDQALVPSTPWAVLIPAARHFISDRDEHYGIDSMTIGEDTMVLPGPARVASTLQRVPSDQRYVLHLPRALFAQQPDVDLSEADD